MVWKSYLTSVLGGLCQQAAQRDRVAISLITDGQSLSKWGPTVPWYDYKTRTTMTDQIPSLSIHRHFISAELNTLSHTDWHVDSGSVTFSQPKLPAWVASCRKKNRSGTDLKQKRLSNVYHCWLLLNCKINIRRLGQGEVQENHGWVELTRSVKENGEKFKRKEGGMQNVGRSEGKNGLKVKDAMEATLLSEHSDKVDIN